MALQSNADFRLLNGLPQSALFFDPTFQFLILHLLISVCTQFHHLFFSLPLSRLPWWLLRNTWLNSLLLSILLTWQIQFNRLTLTHETISKSPNRCINSLLYRFLGHILLKTFLSKAASRSVISLFNVQVSAPYVATGLINLLKPSGNFTCHQV
jgi:hypothetical protein